MPEHCSGGTGRGGHDTALPGRQGPPLGQFPFLILLVPLEEVADLAARGTLAVVAGLNVALIRIKSRREALPPGAVSCPNWVGNAGSASSLMLLIASFF